MDKKIIRKFQKTVWDYFEKHKRDLPWRKFVDSPYKVLVSEVMLQQTQASRVVGPYRLFLKRFPNFKSLAKASNAEVLKLWSGLGYYRRALNLKRTAEIVVKEFGGKLPSDVNELVKLPGIGINTAGAILAYVFNKPAVYIETNIRRIYIHHFFQDHQGVPDSHIIPIIEKTLPKNHVREWYQALMDYGTHLAVTVENPNRRSKHYAKQSKYEGSRRQLRAKILKLLLEHPSLSAGKISQMAEKPVSLTEGILAELIKEKFITIKNSKYKLL